MVNLEFILQEVGFETMGSSEDSQRSAAIIPARMNKLNSKEFTIVDQVKKLMVSNDHFFVFSRMCGASF